MYLGEVKISVGFESKKWGALKKLDWDPLL